MAGHAVVLLLLVFGASYCSTSLDVITWPPEYHFKVEVLDLETHLKTSMEIWYSSRFNRSCVEINGLKKTYYAPDTYPHMVFANENGKGGTKCIKNTFDDVHTSAMNILPRSLYYEKTGETKCFDDRNVDIWTAQENVHGDWWTKQTLYVLKTSKGVHIPFRHDYELYNLVNGSTLKRLTSKYYDFNEIITEVDVTIADAQSCKYIFEYGNDLKDSYNFLHPDVPSDLNAAFNRYKSIHKKSYHDAEHVIKKNIFEKNWRMIIDHNKKNSTYKLRVNSFADKTYDEHRYMNASVFSHPGKYFQPFPHSSEEIRELVKQLPKNFDLRMEGVIGHVKNQGTCNSCWAFATVAALEGVIARGLAGSRLLDLSEQSIIDCSWRFDTLGCHGAWLGPTMDYVLKNGIPMESDYPYKDGDGRCMINKMQDRYNIRGYVLVTPGDHDAMKLAIYKYGPVAVTVRTNTQFRYYDSGIFKSDKTYSSCRNETMNHAMALVGYGVRDGEEYWIAKNSKGQEWGQDGYILLSAADNNCFLTLNEPYYPVF